MRARVHLPIPLSISHSKREYIRTFNTVSQYKSDLEQDCLEGGQYPWADRHSFEPSSQEGISVIF